MSTKTGGRAFEEKKVEHGEGTIVSCQGKDNQSIAQWKREAVEEDWDYVYLLANRQSWLNWPCWNAVLAKQSPLIIHAIPAVCA